MNMTHFAVYLRFNIEAKGNLRENWPRKILLKAGE